MPLPTIAFDTSALNALAKGRLRTEPYIKALNCGFDVCLPAMSVDELIATTNPEIRELLIDCCQRLLVSGRCIWPPHEIVKLLVSAHARDSVRFDWRHVDIRARVYEQGIIRRDFPEELCVQQMIEQRQTEQEFMDYWAQLRIKLAPVIANNPKKRPRSYRQAIEIATLATPNLVWGIGRGLYRLVTGTTLADGEIEAFLNVCPPFQAACYGLCGPWYDVSLALKVHRKLAGRNDQMMSAYLPFCSRFVTEDKKQLARLRDIALEAKLDCEVLSYKRFCAGLDVGRLPGN